MNQIAAPQSIADLQADRERLRAANAKDDFEAALAATVSAAEVMAAGAALRRMLLDALDAVSDRFVSAIAGEKDETRAHFLLSEEAYHWLTALGETAQAVSAPQPLIGDRFRRGVKPRDLLTVSEWADRHRELRSGTNAPGPWRTDFTPYLREIMDCLSEHSAVRQVTFIKSSGVGGTEAMFNWIGYIMHHLGNKDVLCVMPTLDLRDRSFNPKLSKMLKETAALSDMVRMGSRQAANRGDIIEFGSGAQIIKTGANSPDALRSVHLPYVVCDEVDAFPWDVGGEGDPLTLIENRQKTFSRAKTFLISTPTKESESRITQQYERSDQRRYYVPCPHCGEYQHLEWGGKDRPYGLKFRRALQHEGEETSGPAHVERAWYVCKECGAEIDEAQKTDMLAKGRWVAARPSVKHHRGYHINALYAPIGLGLSWQKIAQKWINAQGDSAELKAFANTYLGEVFREAGDSIEEISLHARCEEYPETLPTLLRTAGVDVQKDRLEITVVDWGVGEEAWLNDHIIIAGDTAAPDIWDELEGTLKDAGVQIAAIDSGYNATQVYEFVKRRRWCHAIKGVSGFGHPLVQDERRRRQRLRVKTKRGISIEPVGVDGGKVELYSRLKNVTPGPGYFHFPRDPAFDATYFQQLASEKLVTIFAGYRPKSEWKKIHARNEALDCLLYAMVAMRLAGDGWKTAKVGAGGTAVVKESLTADERRDEQAARQAKPPARPPPRPRTIARDDWSSRL